MLIHINGGSVEWHGLLIGHDDVLKLANMPKGSIVSYLGPKRGAVRRSGQLEPSGSVVSEAGMKFTVSPSKAA